MAENTQAIWVDSFWFIDNLSRLLNFYRYDRYRCAAAATVMCQRFFLRRQPYVNNWIDEICNYSFLLIYSGESIEGMVIPDEWKESMLWVQTLILLTLEPDEMEVDLPHELFFDHIVLMQPHIRHFCYQLLNDGLLTTAFLVFPPHYLVAGALYAAKKLFGYPFRDDWWEQYGLTPDHLEVVGEFFCESQRIKQQSSLMSSFKYILRTLHTTVEGLSQKLADANQEIQRLTRALAESHRTTN
ncbi:cyclin-T1-1 isoform X2 [Manihot esculenta]|uniref:Uncharacterized protein n=1 Tax=Manihot esculenta TaxID=3983 RepID=A0ACB7HFP2_MANES|nr:cyclin-T1-1 isoform X2 [Manihot esculenta]KAG8651427.1 hypothetical protein MANES_07G123900v8 [Manihot esculenta]